MGFISKDGTLVLSGRSLQAAELKPVVYAPIPAEFDQETQAVYQDGPVDRGDHIECGVVVMDLPPDEGVEGDIDLVQGKQAK